MKKLSKKKTTFLFITIFLTAAFLLSCSSLDDGGSANTEESSKDALNDVYASLIIQLQDKLEKLEAEQSAADSENDKKLNELKNSLDSLTAQTDADSEEESSVESQSPTIEPHFTYATEGNSATITGFTGDSESLVIPSYIDGYKVVDIADSAFSSKSLKRVIISDGITGIGWFAFYDCPSLTSVTIPSSVKKIGHSAFSSTAKFTLYCHDGSFAHSFAQSYGIDFALI